MYKIPYTIDEASKHIFGKNNKEIDEEIEKADKNNKKIIWAINLWIPIMMFFCFVYSLYVLIATLLEYKMLDNFSNFFSPQSYVVLMLSILLGVIFFILFSSREQITYWLRARQLKRTLHTTSKSIDDILLFLDLCETNEKEFIFWNNRCYVGDNGEFDEIDIPIIKKEVKTVQLSLNVIESSKRRKYAISVQQ